MRRSQHLRPQSGRKIAASFGLVLKSSTVARVHHFAAIFGLMPNSTFNCASEACDRCIAALMANVVVALL
jgi:hypothetical protein